ncbi:hypothetical protein RF55_11097 [Lasius niger]|uniref:Uncharacterized protein n=1 Tax=Lasius niger TaxID=67767 RepID=A0A0J7KGF4_LASNI|nr:hypothetical protein RF55_11097 [Lasius niger]
MIAKEGSIIISLGNADAHAFCINIHNFWRLAICYDGKFNRLTARTCHKRINFFTKWQGRAVKDIDADILEIFNLRCNRMHEDFTEKLQIFFLLFWGRLLPVMSKTILSNGWDIHVFADERPSALGGILCLGMRGIYHSKKTSRGKDSAERKGS